jgi:peroxiredoxin
MLAPSATLLPVGIVAPDFTLSTPNGTKVHLADYRGKAILLEFFATWCPHCQAEAQHLLRLYQGLPNADFAFLSVNADSEDAGSIHAFGRYFGLPWPELLDQGSPAGSFAQAGGPGQVTQSYGIGLYPTFFIIDKKGKIAWRSDREQPDTLLLQQLQNASGS